MKITARVNKVLELQSGETKAGKEWKKQGILVHQFNDFKDELLIDMWNDNIVKVEKGKTYEFEVNIKSKEWKDKYFTNVSCNYLSPAHEVNEKNPF